MVKRAKVSSPESSAPEPEKPVAAEPGGPEPAASVAERLVEERRARADGSSTARVRAYRERKRQAEQTAAVLPTPEEVQEAGLAFAFVWDLAVVPLSKERLRSLNESQAQRCGRVMAPLVKKYLPLLQAWQLEIAAVMAVAAVVRETARTPDEYAEHLEMRKMQRAEREADHAAQPTADSAEG